MWLWIYVQQRQSVRVVDPRLQKLKPATNALLGKMRLLYEGRIEVLPETQSLALASPQGKKLIMSQKCREDTISRHVKSDGCVQGARLMWVFS